MSVCAASRAAPARLHSVALEQQRVRSLYATRGTRLLWFSGGRPTGQARALLQILHNAGDYGLMPEDYHADALMSTVTAWQLSRPLPGGTVSAAHAIEPDRTVAQTNWDLQFSASLLAFIDDLHAGRIDPRAAGFELPARSDGFDPLTVLQELSSASAPAKMLASIEPAGQGTYAALTVPLDERVRQMELTLERWRWLPPLHYPTIIVNVREFRLIAFDVRPYWDIPRSIALREVLPALARDPDYLQRQQMQLVRGPADNSPVVPATAQNLRLLASGNGGLRLRQLPGRDNALGPIKFLLPNAHDVYLHSTPAVQLFGQAQRAFSHGCIRVADAVTLAQYIQQGTPGNWARPIDSPRSPGKVPRDVPAAADRTLAGMRVYE